jgi:hypothetical protein
MSRQPEKLPDARAAPSAGTEIGPGRFMGRIAAGDGLVLDGERKSGLHCADEN